MIFITYEVLYRIMLSRNRGVTVQVIVAVQIAQASKSDQDK